ncbi:MAG: hypothetical protein KatS3mg029_0574 [Saprospiraceae bacterium]|nr:MAG: hypothetical protein KatS3mg029_0574 [Saprospiraceae bacterium]
MYHFVFPVFLLLMAMGSSFGQVLSNPNASEGAHQTYEFLANFHQDSARCLMLGQNLGWNLDQFEELVAPIHQQTNRWPAILGGLLRPAPEEIDYTAFIQLCVNWQEGGGLIELGMLPDNPWTGGDTWDLTATDIWKLTTPGQDGFDEWTEQLDFMADILKQLQDQGVTVLWRPLHEMNGDWFWYGFQGDSDAQPYIELYRDMFDYFTNFHQLNNLIWVYAPNWASPGLPQPTHYYPGSDVVDMTGLDIYLTDLDIPQNQYTDMLNLGLPFAITEFGPSLDEMSGNHDYNAYVQKILEDFPQSVYAQAWSDWPGHAASWIANQNFESAFLRPCIVHRDLLSQILTSTSTSNSPAALQLQFFPHVKGAQMLGPPETKILAATMHDILGRSWPLEKDARNWIFLPQLESFPPGLFFIHIDTNLGTLTHKLILH